MKDLHLKLPGTLTRRKRPTATWEIAAQRRSSYAWPRRSFPYPAMVAHGAAGGRGDDSNSKTNRAAVTTTAHLYGHSTHKRDRAARDGDGAVTKEMKTREGKRWYRCW